MPVSYSDVCAAYRFILGREPEIALLLYDMELYAAAKKRLDTYVSAASKLKEQNKGSSKHASLLAAT